MACPFLRDPIDEDAVILHKDLHTRWEFLLRPRLGVLEFFSLQPLAYLYNLIRLPTTTVTNRGRALTSERILCVAPHFFRKMDGYFLHDTQKAEHVSEATVCGAVREMICHNNFTYMKKGLIPTTEQSNKTKLFTLYFGLCYLLQMQK